MEEVRNLDRGFSLSDVLSEAPLKHADVDSISKQANEVHVGLTLENIEEGELDYEDDEGGVVDDGEDLPDLPEYDPAGIKNVTAEDAASEEGEILSDEHEDREEGEIKDEDDTGQVFVCVDPVKDKWKKVSKVGQKRLGDLEDGQLDDKPEDGKVNGAILGKPGIYIPRTLCKYFNQGLCRWGSTCRFLHPGVNEAGVPVDLRPTWNATAGNYVMHRPPGMYPNTYGKAPPPMQGSPVISSPMDMQVPPVIMQEPPRRESAWERGLQRAKEVREAAARRRQEDDEFETKRFSMRIPEHVMEKEPLYQPEDTSNVEKTIPMWEFPNAEREQYDSRNERYNTRYADRFAGRFNRIAVRDEPDKSSGRFRMPELLRENRHRDGGRSLRVDRPLDQERDQDRDKDRARIPSVETRVELDPRGKEEPPSDPRRRSPPPPPPPRALSPPVPVKPVLSATEWHDPWMRTQPTVAPVAKPEDTGKVIVAEAISDSDSSTSDSDSDSDSSSSKSSESDSDSDSSSDELLGKKNAVAAPPSGMVDVRAISASSGKAEVIDGDPRLRDASRRRDERRDVEKPASLLANVDTRANRDEPLSYEEWKRLQALQKAEYQQQLAGQYKKPLDKRPSDLLVARDAGKPEHRHPGESRAERHERHRLRDAERAKHGAEDVRDRSRDADATHARSESRSTRNSTLESLPKAPMEPVSIVNKEPTLPKDPRLDAIKSNGDRNSPSSQGSAKDSDSDSDTDSDSESDSESATDSDSSDSSDSDSDSDSDKVTRPPPPAVVATPIIPPVVQRVPELTPRNDVKLAPSPVKVEPPKTVLAVKRPARKDELLKELKAVEDAIARKRAKID